MPGLLVSLEGSASEYFLLLFTDSSKTLVHGHTINAIRFFFWPLQVHPQLPVDVRMGSKRHTVEETKLCRMAGEAYKYRV
jgi:hypothetical protein